MDNISSSTCMPMIQNNKKEKRKMTLENEAFPNTHNIHFPRAEEGVRNHCVFCRSLDSQIGRPVLGLARIREIMR